MTCIQRRGTLKSIGQITVYLKVTVLFTNMRILKFKIQLMIAFFAAVNHLKGPFRKFVICNKIGGFHSVLHVSVFQGSLLLIVIMIDGSEKTQM